MSNQERKQHGAEPRVAETKGIEVRPRNWLVPVILLTLREFQGHVLHHAFPCLRRLSETQKRSPDCGTYTILVNSTKCVSPV